MKTHYIVELNTPTELMTMYFTAFGAVLVASAFAFFLLNLLDARRSL